MLWTVFMSMARHHSESVDPDLADWIKDRMDHVLNLGPWTIIVALGFVIAMIPISIAGTYIWQQRRYTKGILPPAGREDE